MAELKAIYDEQQRLSSRIDVLEETMRGVKHDLSAPTSPVSVAPAEVDLSDIEKRLLKLEVDAAKPAAKGNEVTEEDLAKYRGKPGRKPKHIQEALDAEEKEEAA